MPCLAFSYFNRLNYFVLCLAFDYLNRLNYLMSCLAFRM